MSKQAGQYYKFYIDDPGNPGTFLLLGCLTEHAFEKLKELIDATCFDGTEYADFLQGTKSATGTISGLYNWEDAGQAALDAIYNANTATPFKIAGLNVGDPEITGDAHFTLFRRTFPLNGPSAYDLEYTAVGPVTEGTVGP